VGGAESPEQQKATGDCAEHALRESLAARNPQGGEMKKLTVVLAILTFATMAMAFSHIVLCEDMTQES
jgi:hypothetical protein